MKEAIPANDADTDEIASSPDSAPSSEESVETDPMAVESPAKPAPVDETKVGGLGWLLRVGVNAGVVLAVAALVLVMIGVAQRTKWITPAGFAAGGDTGALAAAGGGGNKRYICPMMCTPPSTEPGRCPVCAMELVEATAGGGGDGISVTIDSSARTGRHPNRPKQAGRSDSNDSHHWLNRL